MTVLVLGDQLHPEYGPVADADHVLLIEAHRFARRHAHHPHKLTLVFAAMRQFRDELREQGVTVDYYQCETFGEGFDAHFEANPGDELTVMEPQITARERDWWNWSKRVAGVSPSSKTTCFSVPERCGVSTLATRTRPTATKSSTE